MTKELDAAPGDIRSLKYRIHELEGEVIGYKRILDEQGKAKPVAVAHVGNMDHGPFDITPTAYGCDHLKNGDELYTSPPATQAALTAALEALKTAQEALPPYGAIRRELDAAIAQIEALKGPTP